MEKTIIIINGVGGVGKDTLCNFASELYSVTTISSITPVKIIAQQCGWGGEKDPKSRKFLSDLKKLLTNYNDKPFDYLTKEYKKFVESNNQILFVQIREGEEIEKFRRYVALPCVTLLICRDNVLKKWGNEADDNVNRFKYDYTYHNDKSFDQAKEDFIMFLQNILNGRDKYA